MATCGTKGIRGMQSYSRFSMLSLPASKDSQLNVQEWRVILSRIYWSFIMMESKVILVTNNENKD